MKCTWSTRGLRVRGGAGEVSALIMGNRLGGLTVSISAGGAIVFIVGSLNERTSPAQWREWLAEM